MKTLTLVISYLLFAMTINAQEKTDTWNIKWKGEVILSATAENEKENVKSVVLDDATVLVVRYKEGVAKADWARSILIFGEGDNELMRINNKAAKIGGEELKKAIGNNKTIKIYTVSLPTDPEMAARVRVRRVHLCTLVLN
jgi:hypothetical protein